MAPSITRPAPSKRDELRRQVVLIRRLTRAGLATPYVSIAVAGVLVSRAGDLATAVYSIGVGLVFVLGTVAVFGCYLLLGLITPPPIPLSERNVAAQTAGWLVRWMGSATAMVISVLIGIEISASPTRFLHASGEVLVMALVFGSIAASLGLAVRLKLCRKEDRRSAWLQSWWSAPGGVTGSALRLALLAARSWTSSAWSVLALYLTPTFLFTLSLLAWGYAAQ